MKILVTGGLGFIGSALIRYIITKTKNQVLNIDSMSKVAMPEALEGCEKSKNYKFIKLEIQNTKIKKVIKNFSPDIIFNLAAESHVDNSITSPRKFIDSNIYGTFNILEACRLYLEKNPKKIKKFRFIQVSTDEVYGSLNSNQKSFNEDSSYKPNSPYSASKASSDYLVRAWFKTFNIPSIITHCSNNYGPWQFPEKLIPLMISKGIQKKFMPIYGNGKNIRDWLYVDDHVSALLKISKKGKIGEVYNIGGDEECTNIKIVNLICKHLDNIYSTNAPHKNLIRFVKDRKGHDFRYSIDFLKLKNELGWSPKTSFEKGLKITVDSYLKGLN